jgi:hypothetical protein
MELLLILTYSELGELCVPGRSLILRWIKALEATHVPDSILGPQIV